jgi:hypothetical protein
LTLNCFEFCADDWALVHHEGPPLKSSVEDLSQNIIALSQLTQSQTDTVLEAENNSDHEESVNESVSLARVAPAQSAAKLFSELADEWHI